MVLAPGRIRALVLVVPSLVVACSSQPMESSSGLPVGTLRIETRSGTEGLQVEIAGTEATRQKGLMGRRSLPREAGMVFLFGQPSSGAFWMKDTLIPLSIAFWDGDRRIVAILDMAPCRSEPCPLYSPGKQYAGAVETNQGWFEQHDVDVGDRIELLPGLGQGT